MRKLSFTFLLFLVHGKFEITDIDMIDNKLNFSEFFICNIHICLDNYNLFKEYNSATSVNC